MFTALGVHPFAYLPFAFLNLINPVVSVIYGYTGITMEKLPEAGAGKTA
jgi:NhaC family Na+:H+ antiporter